MKNKREPFWFKLGFTFNRSVLHIDLHERRKQWNWSVTLLLSVTSETKSEGNRMADHGAFLIYDLPEQLVEVLRRKFETIRVLCFFNWYLLQVIIWNTPIRCTQSARRVSSPKAPSSAYPVLAVFQLDGGGMVWFLFQKYVFKSNKLINALILHVTSVLFNF